NEKRSEIQKLEGRLKVNIVLVPNPHLETPHYKVQRLRHDELNEMEHVPSSYEMVERPEEPKAPGVEEEGKRERQEAVVKGITPSQPAPVVPDAPTPREPVPAPQPALQPTLQQPAHPSATAGSAHMEGFFSRFLSIFRAPAEPAEPAAAPLAASQPQQRPQQTPPQQRGGEPRRGEPRRDHRQGGERSGGERREGPDGRRDGRRDEHRDRQQQGRLEQRRNGPQRHVERAERPNDPGDR